MLSSLQDAAEATAQERAFLTGVFSAGGFRRGEFVTSPDARRQGERGQRCFARPRDARARRPRDYTARHRAGPRLRLLRGRGGPVGRRPARRGQPAVLVVGQTTVLDDMTGSSSTSAPTSSSCVRAAARGDAAPRGLLVVVLLCVGGSIYLAVLASPVGEPPARRPGRRGRDVAAERLPGRDAAVRAFDPEGGTGRTARRRRRSPHRAGRARRSAPSPRP